MVLESIKQRAFSTMSGYGCFMTVGKKCAFSYIFTKKTKQQNRCLYNLREAGRDEREGNQLTMVKKRDGGQQCATSHMSGRDCGMPDEHTTVWDLVLPGRLLG